MKILFANPAYRIDLGKGIERYFFCAGSRCPWSLIKSKKSLPRYAMFPFFMGYAAAILEKEGYEIEVIDAVPLNLTLEDFFHRAVNAKPDVILLEPATTSFNWNLQVVQRLKQETQAIIVLAGPHVSVLAKETLENNSCIDYLLLGEYEFSLLGLIQTINNRKNLHEIEGIAFRNKTSEIIIHEKISYTELDSLPMPARHLFPSREQSGMKYYHDGFCQNRPAIQMHSSRGCPFTCNFCLWTQTYYKQGTYRMASATKIVDEMIHVKEKFDANEVYFDDDTFTGNKKHVLQICDEIISRKLKIPWSVMGDAIITDEEMLIKMKAAGCIGIKLGLESCVSDILNNINKPLKLKKLESIITICKRLRLKTHVSVSFGHFGETEKTIKQTLDYVIKLDTDSIQFSLATPYPGTRFYDEVVGRDLLIAKEWNEFDPTHNPIVNLPGLSPDILKETESKAHGYWLRRKVIRPEWVLRQVYFLLYILKRQGLSGLRERINRAFDIIFFTKFK
jgi:anaerobic magnesium-protoporphyrin IX monomethyl ester cyclase